MLKLFERSPIGSMNLKNRIFLCPMGTTTDLDGGISSRNIRYFEERAKGGAGLIFASMGITGKFNDCVSFRLDNFSYIPRLSELINHVHHHGAKFCAQLVPGMGRVNFDPNSGPVYSSSATKAFWNPNVTCTPYTVEDIKVVVEAMGAAAAMAKMAGADAIEIHGYGGYLVDQFMSSLWNTRTDEYGGDLKGRMRFALELVGAARAAVGADFPILFKFAGYHGIPGGRELAEGVEIAKILEEAGVTALHVDKGCYECWYDSIDTTYEPDAHQLDIAAAIKAAVTIPVLGQGKLWDPEIAEKALTDEKLDYVGLGHQLLADPEWPKKVLEGRTYDIRPCIGCNECMYSGFVGAIARCGVNPQFMHEEEYQLSSAKEKKSILVVGGGPGGLAAAVTAAERGFSVELWEKNNSLGGNLIPAGAPIFKNDVKRYVEYLKNKAYRNGVTIKLMKDAQPEEIIRENFDKVILATGSKPIMPKIQGIEGPNVRSFDQVLRGGTDVGGKAVIIGGGHVGCETALHLKQIGVSDVTIIEMLDDILFEAKFAVNVLMKLRSMVAESGIQVISSARVEKIQADGVAYMQEDKKEKLLCDTVVIATGLIADNRLESALQGMVKDLSVIGDAVKARKVITAVHEGYHTVRVFE